MTTAVDAHAVAHNLATSRPLRRTLLLLLVAFIFLQAFSFYNRGLFGKEFGITDFDAFYVTGRLFWEGNIVQAYDPDFLRAAQERMTGDTSFMPWSYLPPFTAVTAIFPLMPLPLAYLLFTLPALWFFYRALRQLCGDYAGMAMLAAMPAMMVSQRCGQTGYWIAGFMAYVLIGYQQNRPSLGWALGAMIIKPHLNLTQSLLLCVEKRWRMLAVAALFVVASLLISTWILQPDIWPAFLKGAQSTADFMAAGAYQFRRMTSVFTSLGLMGLSASIAFALHICVALASVAILLVGWYRQWPRHWLAAGAIFSTLFINPYVYDYDLVALALPIGLLLPDYLQRSTRYEPFLALLLAWLSSANFLLNSWSEAQCMARGLDERCFDFSLSPWALLLLIGHMAWVLRRPARLSAVH